MSASYKCDRCGEPMEPEQALGYRLEVAGFTIVLKPEGHLCPPCIVALLQTAAEATTKAVLETAGATR